MTYSKGEELLATQLMLHGLNGYVREYPFYPGRKFRFDFAFPGQKIAVEVEGGSYVAGRHNRAGGFEKDCEKYNLAALGGWRVLRYTTTMVIDGRAVNQIKEAVTGEAGPVEVKPVRYGARRKKGKLIDAAADSEQAAS